MKKIQKFLKSKYYAIVVTGISLLFWSLSYIYNKKGQVDVAQTIDNCSILLVGIVGILTLSFFNTTNYFIPWLLMAPFLFSRTFNIYNLPKSLFITIGLAIIGLIINYFRFKPKIKKGVFLPGLISLAIGMMLGGLLIKEDYINKQILIIGLIVVAFILFYLYLSSTATLSFNEVALLLTYLGIFLSFQVFIYFIVNGYDKILTKEVRIGWGISNNIALMLLLTSPFSAYLIANNKGIKCVLSFIASIIQFFVIIFVYSRGAIFSLALTLVPMIIYLLIKAIDKKTFLISSFVTLFVIGLSGFLLYCFRNDDFNIIINTIKNVNLENLNGRKHIYEEIIAKFKDQPIFGYGLFGPFTKLEGTGNKGYDWGHSTIFHTMFTMGSVGLVLFGYHLFQKYYVLFKKPTSPKFIIALSFISSGIYGLFDVSYYFIYYMVVLVMIFIITDYYLKNGIEYKE